MQDKELWISLTSQSSDDDLFENLARYSIGSAIADDLVKSGVVEEDIPIGFQAAENLLELGRRILSRISRELHNIVCGSSAGDDEAKRIILQGAGLSQAVVISTVTGLIQNSLGLKVAICVAAATLIYRHIIAPAGDEVCKFWKDKFI